MKNITIYAPAELKQIRKGNKLSQADMCSAMGMSKNSHKMIGLYEESKGDIVSYHAWETLQAWIECGVIHLTFR
jgi:transcriptional regulator with XRE-family HTH domain